MLGLLRRGHGLVGADPGGGPGPVGEGASHGLYWHYQESLASPLQVRLKGHGRTGAGNTEEARGWS